MHVVLISRYLSIEVMADIIWSTMYFNAVNILSVLEIK